MSKTKVKSHFRNGSYVRSHERKLSSAPKPNNTTTKSSVQALVSIAENTSYDSAKALIDRKGQVFHFASGVKVIENADFSGFFFENLKMSGITFVNCNFKNAKFKNSYLNDVKIRNSNFSEASFENSTVLASSWENSDFSKVNFNETAFTSTDVFRKVNFSEAKMENVMLQSLHFIECDLQGLLAVDSDWRNVTVEKSAAAGMIWQSLKLNNAKIKDSNMSGSLIKNSDLGGAYLTVIQNTNMSNVRIEETNLNGIQIRADRDLDVVKSEYWSQYGKVKESIQGKISNFLNRRKMKKNMRGLSLVNVTADGVTLSNLDLSRSTITGSSFVKSYFSDLKMDGIDLTGCSFVQSNFQNVSAKKIDGQNCDFSSADFGAYGVKSDFSGSNFAGANFDDTILGDTNFKNCKWVGSSTKRIEVIPGAYQLKIVEEKWGSIESLKDVSYDHHNMHDTAKRSGLSDGSFEFLVISGAIEVRHNLTKLRVKKNFDPTINHIPAWQMQNMPTQD